MMGDGEVRAKQFEYVVVKLSGVVRDDYLGNSKLTNDVFPNEVSGVSFCDLGERFCFYPLCEVINGDD